METLLYSTLKPKLLKSSLIKGTLLGAFGVFAMVAASQFVTANELIFLGPLVALASFFLIAYGFKPYRILKDLERNPLELGLSNEGISFQGAFFPKTSIEKIDYIEEGSHYGIRLTLNHPVPLHKEEEPDEDLSEEPLTQEGDNKVFIPYFSEISTAELKNSFNIL